MTCAHLEYDFFYDNLLRKEGHSFQLILKREFYCSHFPTESLEISSMEIAHDVADATIDGLTRGSLYAFKVSPFPCIMSYPTHPHAVLPYCHGRSLRSILWGLVNLQFPNVHLLQMVRQCSNSYNTHNHAIVEIT